jgi:tripartite-type tricarboxylate transporter receptor subunit TctC
MVQDEFLLWVKQDAPFQNVGEFLKAVGAKNGDWNMGGALSKDTDEMLTRLIEKTARVKMTFVPFKSGGEAAVQLAGGHVGSHTNNPSESVGQWKAGTQRPLCVFNTQGLAIPVFQQPRTTWLPAKVSPEQVAFYVDLMKKVQATPEWKEYIERTQQTSVFLSGEAFQKLITEDMERTRKIGVEQGWITAAQ